MSLLSLVNIGEQEDGLFHVSVKRRGRTLAGSFETVEEAMRQRDTWRRELHLSKADDAAWFLRTRTGIEGLRRTVRELLFG